MATEHICSCLLFFGVKLLAKIWDISHSSLQEQKKSDGVRRFSWDVYPKMSIRQVQIYFACALSNLPLKRKLCGCIQGHGFCFETPLQLFGCTTGRVTVPLMKGKPCFPEIPNKRLCVCSVFHLSCGQHFAPEEISQSGCLNNIIEII